MIGGIALAARAGWDPLGLAGALHTLQDEESLAGGDPDRVGFLATHPSSRERVATIQELARKQTRASAAPIAGTRNAFLGRFEGLVIGDNPATGVFLGTLFVHPELDVAIEAPAGWKTANTPAAAGAVAPPDGDAAVLLGVAGPGADPVAGAKADGLKDPDLKRLERLQVSGLPAVRALAETRDGDRVALTWIAHRKQVFRVTEPVRRRDWERHRPPSRPRAASVRSAPRRPRASARAACAYVRRAPARAWRRSSPGAVPCGARHDRGGQRRHARPASWTLTGR